MTRLAVPLFDTPEQPLLPLPVGEYRALVAELERQPKVRRVGLEF